MPFEWKLPPAQCNVSSQHQIQRRSRKSLHWINRKTLETKELLAQIVIHQQEIRTQHSTIKISVGSKRQKPRHPRNIMENQEIRASLQQQLKRCILCLGEKMAIITFPEQQKLLNKRSELISKCRHENKFLLHYYESND